MSDIYLQITETPAVVTLSAPVISGALSSTVTVANVVSVNVVTMPAITVQAASVTTVIGTVTVGNSVTIGSLPAISGTVTAGGRWYNGAVWEPTPFLVTEDGALETVSVLVQPIPAGTNRIGVVTIGGGTVTIGAGTSQIGSVTVGNTVTISGTVTASPTGTQTIAGTVTANGLSIGSTVANVFPIGVDTLTSGVRSVTDLIGYRLPISLGDSQAVVSASLSDPLPAGTNRIGVVTIGGGTVTIGAGSSQIGSVTASISGTVPISISSVTIGNSVTIGSLPALIAGTAQIGSVTASISNTVVTIYSAQGTTVTNSNFTSTTASTTLVSAVAGRDVLTVFNEGAGNLFISPGATATTISYQVRLSAGDYWECPEGQRSLIHTAVFATAGTARVTEVS